MVILTSGTEERSGQTRAPWPTSRRRQTPIERLASFVQYSWFTSLSWSWSRTIKPCRTRMFDENRSLRLGENGKLIECPVRVISAVLTVGRSVPVYPDKQTSSDPVGMSQRCQFLP